MLTECSTIVLQQLVLNPGQSRYELARTIRELAELQSQSTVYKAVKKLEAEGLVVGVDLPGVSRGKVPYKLTPTGRFRADCDRRELLSYMGYEVDQT